MRDVRSKLLRWYDREARDLPWRRTKDPYAIWVSEVMLQQTRVETVVPYYQRFVERFPTLRALAEADEDAVLSLWSGLGYYRRARHLHRGVREVVARYGGAVPEDAGARLGLPGVGRYTAGAIGSIAFDKEEPVVDGNVSRVLCRLHGVDTPLGTAETDDRLWEEAEQLVIGSRPGDLNQALMELGATVCTPKRPSCGRCPLVDDCSAFANRETERLPVKGKRKAARRVRLAAVVATRGRGPGREVWLTKGDAALFGGLWSVPMAEAGAREALRAEGMTARLATEPICVFDHVLTHRRLEVEVYAATGARARETATRRPFRAADLQGVGLSTLTKKILRARYPSDVLARPRGAG